MKQLTFLKSFFLLCALIVGSNSVWAGDKTITITFNSFSLTASDTQYGTYNWTANGVSGKGTIFAGNSDGAMQFNGNNRLLYNTTPIPGKIKKINIIKASGSNRSYIVYGNTSAYSGSGTSYGTQIGSANIQDGNGRDYTVSSGDYNYFVCYLNTTSTAYLASVTITYEEASSYTITPSVNETTMGSATLSGNIITATPNSGYRVSTTTPYTIIEGAANVTNITQNGNQFTVAATGDCTIRINFEAIPTHTLSSDVSPAGAGTVTFDSSTVAEGSSTTANASANAGYKFTGWSISGTGATLSSTTENPTTVTMGTSDATVTATFEAVTTYAISWSVNGTIVKTDNVEENTAITFPTSITGIPAGYVLKGWVVEANKITGTQNTAPTYVTESTAIAAITYYAVMAVETGNSNTVTLTASWTSSSTSYADHQYTDDKGNTWTGYNSQPTYNSKAYFAIASSQKNSKYTYIKSPQFSGNITSIKMTTYNGSSNARSILIKSTASGTTGDLGSYEMPGGEKLTTEHDINLVENVEFNEFYVGTNDGTNGFSSITVTYGSTSTSNYCTTVPTATVTIAAACNDGNGVCYGTYSNGSAFVVPAADDMTVSAVSVDGDGKLVVTPFDEGDIVKAGTGVMVSSTASGNHTITLATGGTDIDGNMLKGSGDAAISASDMSTAAPSCLYYRLTMHGYVENVNPGVIGFYWGAADGASFAIAANKAYLAVPEAQAAKMSGFAFDDTTTGINGVEEIAPVTKTRKVVKNGRLVIETANGEFTIDGARMK